MKEAGGEGQPGELPPAPERIRRAMTSHASPLPSPPRHLVNESCLCDSEHHSLHGQRPPHHRDSSSGLRNSLHDTWTQGQWPGGLLPDESLPGEEGFKVLQLWGVQRAKKAERASSALPPPSRYVQWLGQEVHQNGINYGTL